MKFTVSQIQKIVHVKPFTFEDIVDVSELESMKNDIRKIKPVQVQGECTVERNEFIFTLNISGTMILPCARTLIDVPYPFELHAVEIFSTAEYLTREEEENEIHPIDGEVIDLKPCILENIFLAIPYRVFSDDKEAHHQAVFKGEGWELTFEEEISQNEKEEKTIDPRLKKLKNLFHEDRMDK